MHTAIASSAHDGRLVRRSLTRADYDRFLPMVRRIATRLARRLPSHVSLQDLVSCGFVGLTEAFARASAAMPENELEAFVSCRIKGAMLDHLRSLDPAAREARNASRRIARAMASLTRALGREPESCEVAEALGVDEDEYRRMLSTIAGKTSPITETIDLEGIELESHEKSPEEDAGRRMLCAVVSDAIEQLPPRLREIVRLSYVEDLTLREIGAVLGVSESRVCQLHREAMQKLRQTVGAL